MERDFTEKAFEAVNEQQLHSVLSFLEEELEKHGAGLKVVQQLDLALEEAFINVAKYAYEGKPVGSASVSLSFEDDEVTICLKDTGMEFDPTAKEDPDTNAKMEDRQIGGLGIYMIKKMVDSFEYERVNGYNVLTMKKKYK